MVTINIVPLLAVERILHIDDIVTALLRDEEGTTIKEVTPTKIKAHGPTVTVIMTSTTISRIRGPIAEFSTTPESRGETTITDEIAIPNLPRLVEIEDAIIVREAEC